MQKLSWYISSLFALLLISGCQSSTPENPALARVYNRVLYLSEMDGLFPDRATAKDSTLIINAFTNRWIREALIQYEAERNLPKDLNIDKLVRDYRASLLRNTYEQVLVEELLDSTIAQEELQAFYEKNKDQYQLETPIIRCRLIKVGIPAPKADSLRLWWNRPNPENLARLNKYCDQYAVTSILNDSLWHRLEEIAIELPKGTLTSANATGLRDFQQRDNQFQYYFKVFEVRNRKEIAPLGFIAEQARKVILHSRKIKLLEEKQENLYDLELRRKNIEILVE